jgi:hypothetical protein
VRRELHTGLQRHALPDMCHEAQITPALVSFRVPDSRSDMMPIR